MLADCKPCYYTGNQLNVKKYFEIRVFYAKSWICPLHKAIKRLHGLMED